MFSAVLGNPLCYPGNVELAVAVGLPVPNVTVGRGKPGAGKRPYAYYLANLEAARQRKIYYRRQGGVLQAAAKVSHPAASAIAVRQAVVSPQAMAVLIGEL